MTIVDPVMIKYKNILYFLCFLTNPLAKNIEIIPEIIETAPIIEASVPLNPYGLILYKLTIVLILLA